MGVISTYVALDRQRQGVASRLFAATFEATRAKGFEKLFAFVRSDNPAALASYRRHGFQAIGVARKQAKVQGRYIDEIMIERFLKPEAEFD